MKPIEIEVTQEDIDSGIRCQPGECPLAIAIARATGAEFVKVEFTKCLWRSSEGVVLADIPIKATNFIHAFDDSDSTYATYGPFKFWLAPRKKIA